MEHKVALKKKQVRTPAQKFVSKYYLFINPEAKKHRYIYWYAFGEGRINNVYWGFYDTKALAFELEGQCHINLDALQDIRGYKKKSNYLYLSGFSSDEIKRTFDKFGVPIQQVELFMKNKPKSTQTFAQAVTQLEERGQLFGPKKQTKKLQQVEEHETPIEEEDNYDDFFPKEKVDKHPNRLDVAKPFDEIEFFQDMSQRFLYFAERNTLFFNKVANQCRRLDTCQKEHLMCDEYTYGIDDDEETFS